MQITKSMLVQAERDQVLPPGHADLLWAYFQQKDMGSASFKTAHMLYYLGGMMAILAMSFFMTVSYSIFGPHVFSGIALGCAAMGVWLAERYRRRDQPMLAGIFAVFSIVQVPLMLFGVLSLSESAYHDYHVSVSAEWLLLEAATVLASGLALYRYQVPFLLMPLAITLWYMGMDLAPALAVGGGYDWEFRCGVSVIWGVLVLTLAFCVDLRNKRPEDFAFWLYWCGLLSFTGGSVFLSFSYAGVYEMVAIAVTACLHFLLMMAGMALYRRQLVVFGSIGVFMCLAYLAFEVFEDSDWWWLALCLAGFVVIRVGQLWQRHEGAISARCRQWLPVSVQELVHRRQGEI